MDTDLQGLIGCVRKEFYALRNGMIADTLRKGGLEQKYIFGLQLPQIKGIAQQFRPATEEESYSLAKALWEDKECREARLLACHIMPASALSAEEALEWSEGATTREEADILAFKLLRYLPNAEDLANKLKSTDDPLKKYTGDAIKRFL